MENCRYFEEKFAEFSYEKRLRVAWAMDFKYNCPVCHKIHIIKEDKVNEGIS